MTFDLDLDFEHIVDACSPVDHGVQVWCPYHVTFALTLKLGTFWMHANLETIVCKFGSNPAISLGGEAFFVPAQTFDLDLDLEHTLDAGAPGDHRVQVWWQSGHLPATRSDFRDRHKSAAIA